MHKMFIEYTVDEWTGLLEIGSTAHRLGSAGWSRLDTGMNMTTSEHLNLCCCISGAVIPLPLPEPSLSETVSDT